MFEFWTDNPPLANPAFRLSRFLLLYGIYLLLFMFKNQFVFGLFLYA